MSAYPLPSRSLGSGILRERTFKTRIKSLRLATETAVLEESHGFATFNSGGRGNWQQELRSSRFRQSVLAEFVATGVFVAVGTASVIIGERPDLVPNGAEDLGAPMPFDRRLLISFTFGLMIVALVFSTGGISGGNLNPAVSLALAITRKISALRCACYVVAQCAGAIVGSAFVYSLSPLRFTALAGATNAINFGDPYVGIWSALGGEMLGTAVLVSRAGGVCVCASWARATWSRAAGVGVGLRRVCVSE